MHVECRPVVFVTPEVGGRVQRALSAVEDGHALITLPTQEDVVSFILDAAGEGTPMPALVLVESMGEFSVKVLCDLRKEGRTRSIPVVILADHIDDRRLLTAIEARANAVVAVPRDDSSLETVAKVVRKFWLKFNQGPDAYTSSAWKG